MIKNHYGVTVDSEVPITGVFNANNLEFIFEDSEKGIDLEYVEWLEEHEKECKEEDHWDCCDNLDKSKILIGYKRFFDEESFGETYGPDENAEYSAILSSHGGNILQVVKSKWAVRSALCSPCCPGQADGDTPGEYLCYAPPPDVIGDINKELRDRIEFIKIPVKFVGIQETKATLRGLILVNEPSGSTITYIPEIHNIVNKQDYQLAKLLQITMIIRNNVILEGDIAMMLKEAILIVDPKLISS